MTCCSSKTPLNPRDYFGWRMCACCQGIAVTPDAVTQNTCWPCVHVTARGVALLYIAGLHAYLTWYSVDDTGAVLLWNNYFVYATNWAIFSALIYFVLINCAVLVLPRDLRPWRLHRGTNGEVKDESCARTCAILLRLCSAILYLAVVFQLVVTSTFWTMLPLSRQAQEDMRMYPWTSAQTHGVVCVCVCAEFLLTTVPVFVTDVWVIALACLMYMTFNALYTLRTGTAIYDYLTWTDEKSVVLCASAVVLVAVCAGLVHLCDRMVRAPLSSASKVPHGMALPRCESATAVYV